MKRNKKEIQKRTRDMSDCSFCFGLMYAKIHSENVAFAI